MRKTVEKLYNKAKISGEWARYSYSLIEYNKVLRKAKRETHGASSGKLFGIRNSTTGSTSELNFCHKTKRADWAMTYRIVSHELIKWAIGTFQPYKMPEANGTFPVRLQQRGDNLVPYLCRHKEWQMYSSFHIHRNEGILTNQPFIFFAKKGGNIIDRHIREGTLLENPPYKHNYEPGK